MKSKGMVEGFVSERKEKSSFGDHMCDFWNTIRGCGKSYNGIIEEASYSLPDGDVHIWIHGDNLSVTRFMGDGYYMEWDNDDEMALEDTERMGMLDLMQVLRSFPTDPFSCMIQKKMTKILVAAGAIDEC